MKTTLRIIAFLSITVFFVSCKDDTKILSSSTGKAGEIVVVANAEIWNGNVGEAVRTILTETDTLLPQPEAKFSIINTSENHFSNIIQEHRNVLIIKTEEGRDKCEVSTKNNVYSAPQTILYIVGADEQQILEALEKYKHKIADIFEQTELERIKDGLKSIENADLRTAVENKYGYSMYFPSDYDFFGDKNEFMWLGLRTTKGTEGVFIYTYPYTDKAQLSLDSLIEKRNNVLQQYVLLDKEPQGSAYMTTTNYIEPAYSTLKIDNQFFARIRGLWEMKNDFMGGPFISYTTVDEEKNMIVTFDGFVYAPSRTKRDLLRRIEGIILTAVKIKK